MLIALWGVSQDKKPEAAKLKDSVALDIRTAQLAVSNNQGQQLSLQLQFAQLQQQGNQLQQQLDAKMKTALKDSELDENKYMVDPSTLLPQEKPPVPAPPAKP